ncbi:MAG TPA: DUF6438 domain-containing protein [Rhizomicrobium sp.]|jgi:hypothetical protein|nr:DUF6438 domain-containing protein [Rhizomicrobium sp.]
MRAQIAILAVLSAAFATASPANAQAGITGYYVGTNTKLPNGGRPAKHIAFPPIKDWNTLRITLQRSPCFGRCPTYKVEIHGDGTVIYRGGSFVAVTGERSVKIAPEKVRDLYTLFRKADYFWLNDSYTAQVTDLPSFTTSISYDGHSKSVRDYAGRMIGMPEIVGELELAIDDAANSEQWTVGKNGPRAPK